jgi:hypothetical protein
MYSYQTPSLNNDKPTGLNFVHNPEKKNSNDGYLYLRFTSYI